MTSDLPTRAVKAALANNWPEAIKLNFSILEENPKDVEALNRLAHAYKETGKIKLGQKTYRRVLAIDCFNPIAQKNLKLLESFPKHSRFENSGQPRSAEQPQFLEEPGKTKVVNLVNLAPVSTILRVSCGTSVNLLIKRRTVNVVTGEGIYLAALPDDLSAKLIKRILAGNRYQAFIKTVAKNSLSVFIREVYCASKFKNQPTFLGTGSRYYALVKPESVCSEEEAETGEEASPEELPESLP